MPCKRIRELCNKLYHPKNSLCRERMPEWYEDSKSWVKTWKSDGEDERLLRMKYILNHLCPNLVHLLPKPNYRLSYYTFEWLDYEFENAQMKVSTCDGRVISEGIDKTPEEWHILLCAIYPLVGRAMNIDFESYLRSEGFTTPFGCELYSVYEEYENMYLSLSKSES